MSLRKNLLIAACSGIVAFSSSYVFAEEIGQTTDQSTQTTESASTTTTTTTTTNSTTTTTTAAVSVSAKDTELSDAIANTLGISATPQDVANMHAAGIGYGEISKAYGIAALSNTTVQNVIGMKQTMGWGKIAQSLGIKVSDVTKSEQAVQNAMDKAKADSSSKQKNSSSSAKSTHDGKSAGSRGGNSSSNGGGHGGGHGGGGGHK